MVFPTFFSLMYFAIRTSSPDIVFADYIYIYIYIHAHIHIYMNATEVRVHKKTFTFMVNCQYNLMGERIAFSTNGAETTRWLKSKQQTRTC